MKTQDDATLRSWLDLELDGALDAALEAQLEERLAERADLRAEREELAALHALLAADRIPVRPGFAEGVTSSLPAAPWARRRRALAGWYLPLALVLTLASSAALLLGRGGVAESAAGGTALAIFDFFQTALIAGAGLLGASWRGVGLAFEELFTVSDLNLWVLALGVILLNGLFFLLLRPRARATQIDRDPDELG